MAREVPFSERIGAVTRVLQKDSMDEALKNSIWNAVYTSFWIEYSYSDTVKSSWQGLLLAAIWMNHFNRPIDRLEHNARNAVSEVRKLYMASDWAGAYDFLDFIANHQILTQTQYSSIKQVADRFVEKCNIVLAKHLSAYRFVGTTLTPITSDTEITAIEQALSHGKKFQPMVTHLETALARLADRPTPDCRNSIKESISAVEAACQIITGDPKATLGKALKQIGLHPALEVGFTKLYGYTSDADGIRHAMLEASTVDADDAKFFLVACSAFINYLISKSATNSAPD